MILGLRKNYLWPLRPDIAAINPLRRFYAGGFRIIPEFIYNKCFGFPHMEKINCKSCGGTLQKIGPADYKCVFCGTMHQLEMDDSESVRALLEQNNQRWLFINKSMDFFIDKVNQASIYKLRLKNPLIAVIIVSGLCVLTLVSIGPNFWNLIAQNSREMVRKDLVPFLSIAGIMLALDAYYLLMIVYGRWRLKKMLNEAQAIIMDVLKTYQQMSEKPAKDMLQSLHNPKKFMDKDALQLAYNIYNQALSQSAGSDNCPGTGQ